MRATLPRVLLALLLGASVPLAAQVGQAATLDELRERAEAGHAWSQLYLGAAYENGLNGARKDMAAAARWYQLSAAQGIPFAQYNLAQMYATGTGVPRDDRLAFFWFEKAALRLAEAQYRVGVAYAEGRGTERSPLLAREWLVKAVAGGSDNAVVYLRTLP